MVSETVELTCGACGRTWERARQRGQKPKRCPSCVRPAAPPPAREPEPKLETFVQSGTGVACRVCGVDDGELRAQPDLHLGCVERATTRAIKRAKAVRAGRVDRAGDKLDRDELIRRLAADRAVAAAPARRGRKNLEEDNDRDEQGEPELTGDEVAAIEMVSRGRGLATDGIG